MRRTANWPSASRACSRWPVSKCGGNGGFRRVGPGEAYTKRHCTRWPVWLSYGHATPWVMSGSRRKPKKVVSEKLPVASCITTICDCKTWFRLALHLYLLSLFRKKSICFVSLARSSLPKPPNCAARGSISATVSQPFLATEETYEYLVDSSTRKICRASVLDSPIEDARRLVGSDKPINQKDVVDYSFRRAALKK